MYTLFYFFDEEVKIIKNLDNSNFEEVVENHELVYGDKCELKQYNSDYVILDFIFSDNQKTTFLDCENKTDFLEMIDKFLKIDTDIVKFKYQYGITKNCFSQYGLETKDSNILAERLEEDCLIKKSRSTETKVITQIYYGLNGITDPDCKITEYNNGFELYYPVNGQSDYSNNLYTKIKETDLQKSYNVYFNTRSSTSVLLKERKIKNNTLEKYFPELVHVGSLYQKDSEMLEVLSVNENNLLKKSSDSLIEEKLKNKYFKSENEIKIIIDYLEYTGEISTKPVVSDSLTIETLKKIIKDEFELSESDENRIKSSELKRIVSEIIVATYNPEKNLGLMLPIALSELGINKKRYKDGNYWYGMKLNNKKKQNNYDLSYSNKNDLKDTLFLHKDTLNTSFSKLMSERAYPIEMKTKVVCSGIIEISPTIKKEQPASILTATGPTDTSSLIEFSSKLP